MLYSSALVVGTLAVGQAAAGNVRHASFHARRNAKPAGIEAIDVKRLAQDAEVYAKINWSTFNWDSLLETVFPKTSATPVPEVNVKATPVAVVTPTSTPEQKPAPSSTQEAAKPSATQKSNIVEDIFGGVEAFSAKIGVQKTGVNDKSNNGAIWIGTGGPLTVKHINNNGQEQFLYCWKSAGFTGMTINVNAPAIAVRLPKDGTPVTTSHAAAVPFACASAAEGTKLAVFGGVNATWFEAEYATPTTEKPYGVGAFDVSRLINPHGSPITAKGSKCTSNFSQCYYECKDKSLSHCGEPGSYTLVDCDASKGGGTGHDAVMKGDGGGCNMSTQGEEIEVRYG